MKNGIAVIAVFVFLFISVPDSAALGRDFLTVDFQENQTLRYKFTSGRDINVDWAPLEAAPKPGKNKVDRYTESMEMIVAYTPLQIDPYGISKIQAKCESVNVRKSATARQRTQQKDAVENMSGKTYTIAVSPSGRIEDYSQLYKLIRETAEKAFRQDTKKGKIKEPDLTADIIALQWFLWDCISSVTKPAEGVTTGQSWKSKLSVPTPMIVQKARDVTYTLTQIKQTKNGRLALIKAVYEPAETLPQGLPMPYPDGTFQMSGTFGFLRGYKMTDLQGEGEEIFNIDKGRIEQYNQHYEAKFDASFPFSFGVNVNITIKQNLTMQLLE